MKKTTYEKRMIREKECVILCLRKQRIFLCYKKVRSMWQYTNKAGIVSALRHKHCVMRKGQRRNEEKIWKTQQKHGLVSGNI